jgi:predicted DNA-binding transcriptional regulator YafY
LTLINAIKTNPRQTPEALWKSLGIGKTMFYKDKAELAGLGFAFEYRRQKGQYLITQDQFLPVLNLTLSEMLALIMAVRQLSSTGDYTLTYRAIDAIKKVIANTTPPEIRHFFQATINAEVLQEGFGCQAEILDDLWRACQEHQRLRIVHDSGQGSQQWTIDPYQIFFKRRALYLDAYVVDKHQIWMFRVNRIQQVAFVGVQVPEPVVDYNFHKRHRHSFSVFVGDPPQRVRVRFDPAVHPGIRQYITETLWHGSQQIEDLPDGRFIFQVEVSEPREVGWWALQWGACAEVLEPEELRREVAETVRKMGQLYES